MNQSTGHSVAALFAGIGGIEVGIAQSGWNTELFCELWEPANQVLAHHFPDVPVVRDVRDVRHLPKVDLVTAGFPCTDLSQAGQTMGISGKASGLVSEVFRLIKRPRVPTVLLENVRNMLVLDGGAAMAYLTSELESLGYKWAYRLVDSRFTGVPQRRQRVIFVASRTMDPRTVIFADEAGEPAPSNFRSDAYGFYWTEGLRGLGWACDAVPPLKGGSTIGIPSPPAIWDPKGETGRRFIVPTIEDAERMQGFQSNWTAPAEISGLRNSQRWKLVGNAVTVGVSKWVGERLANPGEPLFVGVKMANGERWPTSAYGAKGQRWRIDASLWPRVNDYTHLLELVDVDSCKSLSVRGATGFLARARRSNLRFVEGFLDDVSDHVSWLSEKSTVA